MGKKRIKGKTAQSDESPDILKPVCKHIHKGLDQSHVRKALQNVEWDVCQDCKADSKTQEKAEEEETDEGTSIWLCLKCGHRGCDRNSPDQHALKHYETPRSDPHCLVLNLDNWSVWCYPCDNEVPYKTSTLLGQTVDFVRKQVGIDSSHAGEKQENKEVGNKKVEKDSKNKQGKEVSLKEENSHSTANGEVTVKGLSNLGNTCFFNAVMQNLSQTPVLRELLKEAKIPGTTIKIESPELCMEPQLIKLDQPGPLTLAMHQFVTEMQETKKGVVTPKELFAQVCKKAIRFKGYQQQDSHELLRYLLDGMRAEEIQQISIGMLKALSDCNKQSEEELKKKIKEYEKKKGIQSFVDRIFGGELTSTIMCEECRTVSLVHESFLDLSLPVLDVQKGKITKRDNVKKNKEKESEDEEDKINDHYLKQKYEPRGTSEKKCVYTNAKKQMLISLAPPILTLHLKRFQQAGFNLQKVNKHIKFPEVIDLAPFCTAKCKNVAEGNTKVLYSLYGVVEHSGTMRSGHYTAYVKMRPMNNHLSDLVLRGQSQASETEPVKGQWFHISDTHIQPVSVSKVLSSQAYLLFYERLL
ncbi:ubiquitin carboxyl-terminal hydrolase 16 isoform 6-T12 [Geothlypis trichas]